MNQRFVAFSLISVFCILLMTLPAIMFADDPPEQPVYKPANRYPVLREIEAARDAAQAVRDSLQKLVDDRYAAEARAERDTQLSLRLDWSHIQKPASPQDFRSAWHLPPVPQYYTGTCWSFCSTSFFESEVARLTGQQIKLSEMWTVYWEYVERARRFVREYGHSAVAEGSQDHGTLEIYRQYGSVPMTAYAGVCGPDGRHDHTPLYEEINGYLQWVKKDKYWEEEKVVAVVRTILDSYLGSPPESFTFEGRTHTPLSFRDEVLQLNLDDYVNCISTLREPFGQYVVLDVVDNWRRKSDYLNLPLADFYRVIKEAVQAGYTVSLGGDVSEPGLDGYEDAAVIPAWDIPAAYIDQGSREFRIANGTTTDDHGVHAVGYLRHGDRDWFLIKDSNRSSRLGEFKGYYFYAGDYIRLKTLAFMVHKDRLQDLLPQS
jgi:bleomycin hydrolase